MGSCPISHQNVQTCMRVCWLWWPLLECWSEDGKVLVFVQNPRILSQKSNVFFNIWLERSFSHQIHLHPCLCLRNSAARCVVRACGRARSKCTEWAPLYMKCVIRRASGKNRGGFHSSWLLGGSFFFRLKNGLMQQVCSCVPYTNRNVTGTTPKIHFEIFTLAFASRPQTRGHVEINYIPNTPNQYCPTTKFPQDNGGWSTCNFRFYKAFGNFKQLWGVIRGSFQVITDRCMIFFGWEHVFAPWTKSNACLAVPMAPEWYLWLGLSLS